MADAFLQCLDSGLHHRRVTAFSEYDALRMERCRRMQRTGELRLLTQHLTQMILVSIPIGDFAAGHTTIDSSFGHSGRHLGDQTGIDGLRNEVFRTELQVIDMIHLVHNVGHRLLSQICDSPDGGQLHLLIDCLRMHVKRTTEDVGEANDIINLVGVIRAAGRHQNVGAGSSSILVRDLRHRIGQREDDRHVSHRADHILREHITL